MNLRWLVLLAVLSGLTLAGYFFLNQKTRYKPPELVKRDLVVSQSTVQGMLNATYLYEDGTFLVINEFPDLSAAEPSQCYEGKITSDAYDSFIGYLASTNYMDLEVSQDNDNDLLCEGTYSVNAVIDNKSNSLSMPCAATYEESTTRVRSVMDDISRELNEITTASRQECRPGNFLITYDMGSCSALERNHKRYHDSELDYATYEFADLDPVLQESLLYERAYVYAGSLDETVESVHRKYYAIAGSCYVVLASQFDGVYFRSYDSLLRDKNR